MKEGVFEGVSKWVTSSALGRLSGLQWRSKRVIVFKPVLNQLSRCQVVSVAYSGRTLVTSPRDIGRRVRKESRRFLGPSLKSQAAPTEPRSLAAQSVIPGPPLTSVRTPVAQRCPHHDPSRSHSRVKLTLIIARQDHQEVRAEFSRARVVLSISTLFYNRTCRLQIHFAQLLATGIFLAGRRL